jgi:hypothetical protein
MKLTISGLGALSTGMALLITVAAGYFLRLSAILGTVTLLAAVVATTATTTTTLGAVAREVAL